MTPADVASQVVFLGRGVGLEPRLWIARLALGLKEYQPQDAPILSFEIGTRSATDRAFVTVLQFQTAPPAAAVERVVAEVPGTSWERNVTLGRCGGPDDPRYGEQWALPVMAVEGAWACAARLGVQKSVTVAVPDSGISTAHPDLNDGARVFGQRVHVFPEDGHIEDEDGHGTFLSGTIAALTDNSRGLASPLWPAQATLRVMAVKFYDPWTPLTKAHAARAVTCAVDHLADVINASWHLGMASEAPGDVLYAAVRYASDHDVVFVAAAGNEGTDNDTLPTWPASFALPNVVSVMASDRHDDKPGFSNYGDATVHLAAPGVRILSTHYYLGPTPPAYRVYSGTSAAAAHVSAAAVLLRALSPALTAGEIRQHLMSSVDPRPDLRCVARGRLNLARAICGPLEVTGPRATDRWKGGTVREVRWRQAYETPACRTVDVRLSADGGATYPTLLAAAVPVAGGAGLVPVPSQAIPHARIRIESAPGRFRAESPVFRIKV
jgi:subtilisin family serine protease